MDGAEKYYFQNPKSSLPSTTIKKYERSELNTRFLCVISVLQNPKVNKALWREVYQSFAEMKLLKKKFREL